MSERLLGVLSIALGLAGAGILNNYPDATTGWLFILAGGILLGYVFGQHRKEKAAPTPKQEKALVTPEIPASRSSRPIVIEQAQIPRTAVEQRVGFVTQAAHEVVNLYRTHTNLQADRLFAAYIGKAMRITGTLNDVSPHLSGGVTLFVSVDQSMDVSGNTVYAHAEFSKDSAYLVEHLPKGQRLTVEGKLRRATDAGVTLEECGLIPS